MNLFPEVDKSVCHIVDKNDHRIVIRGQMPHDQDGQLPLDAGYATTALLEGEGLCRILRSSGGCAGVIHFGRQTNDVYGHSTRAMLNTV